MSQDRTVPISIPPAVIGPKLDQSEAALASLCGKPVGKATFAL